MLDVRGVQLESPAVYGDVLRRGENAERSEADGDRRQTTHVVVVCAAAAAADGAQREHDRRDAVLTADHPRLAPAERRRVQRVDERREEDLERRSPARQT